MLSWLGAPRHVLNEFNQQTVTEHVLCAMCYVPCAMNTCYVPGAVVGTGDSAVKGTDPGCQDDRQFKKGQLSHTGLSFAPPALREE